MRITLDRQILDLTGEVCPVPLWRTQEAVRAMPAGSVLQVETDFARSVRNISQWCAREGYPYEMTEVDPGLWQIVITKT